MADSTADSTKSEDDSQESTTSKVSSSFSSPSAHNNAGPESSVSASDNNQVTSNSSDTRDSHSVVQPSKFGSSAPSGFWAFGSAHNPGVYSNPFVPRAPLRTDVVSTASSVPSERESLLAPSRLGAAVNKDTGESEAEEKRCKYLKPSMLATPKFGGSGFGGASLARPEVPSSTFSPVNSFHIRPSVFSGPSEASPAKATAPLLKPAKLPDPTKACDADSAGDHEVTEKASEASAVSVQQDGAEGSVGANEVSSSSSTSSSSAPVPPVHCEADGATAADASAYNQDIVPDISKNNKLKDSSGVSSSSSSDFVFGKNLSQRVTGVTSPSEVTNEASASSGFVFGESLSSRAVTEANGSSESPDKDDSDSDSGKMNRTLEESAREYQAKHENKTELKEVERITGEEEESNVLQANAKLFLFNAMTQTWVERGRGVIRLNDMSSDDARTFQSRLVMRTQGSLRVVLNTKIWPGMTVERASGKSVRVTAMDTDENIKVFLIMTNTKDSENLLRAIDWRIQQLKICEETSRPNLDNRGAGKRKADSDFEFPNKSKKMSSPTDSTVLAMKKEESDSSVQDPETEASCESHSSSLTIKSESD
ncbi:ran-binding protein 3 isoform X2 [Aplysia californica]|uniref:Ran-binding protein 3 isoform X2 n=1 Tax=Aplysia californica TaxID=6500 RepID=A0ABM0JIT8_APLCA|nr:ran-binding protein 3 isoform X2 [Aplysia californica]